MQGDRLADQPLDLLDAVAGDPDAGQLRRIRAIPGLALLDDDRIAAHVLGPCALPRFRISRSSWSSAAADASSSIFYLLRFDQRFSAGIGEEDKLIEGEDEAMPGQGLSRDSPDHPA